MNWRGCHRPILASVLVFSLASSIAAEASVPVPEGAHAMGAFDDDEPRVEARLLVHPDDPDSDRSVRIGVLFDLDPGWHLYWRNPGETGLPTLLRWQVDGAVYHWGHAHTRLNEYRARYTVRAGDGGWRIARSEMLEQFRVSSSPLAPGHADPLPDFVPPPREDF